MMPNGMQQQRSMQQPQSGNVQQQIHAKIITDLRQNLGQFQGSWQATMDPRQRANSIMQL